MSADATELRLTPAPTPHGRLLIVPQGDAPAIDLMLATRIREAFDRGSGHGLLHLGAAEVGQVVPAVFAYWRELGSRFATALCTLLLPVQRAAERCTWLDQMVTTKKGKTAKR